VAAVCFAALVFSYFYLWTSAIAVFAGLAIFTLLSRGKNLRADLKFLALTGVLFLVALIPYGWLLAGRNKMADKAQLLVFTRDLDLNRNVEIIGFAVLIVAGLALLFRLVEQDSRKIQFIAALALSPIIVFNQQVLTGRSLQPFHYEFYVINYVVLLAVCLLVAAFWQRVVTPRWATVALALILTTGAIVWGYIEATQTTVFWDDTNVQRDEAMPVNVRLRELAGRDPAQARLQTTINLESLQADSQPTVAPQAVLWARHQHTFAGLESWEENKLRYYQLLYFSGADGNWLHRALSGCADIEACMALFGWDRFNARLSANARPLTQPEVEAEAANYQHFVENFNRDSLEGIDIRYLVIDNELANNLQNIDRWYVRDDGEIFGKYTLYRLTPRN
jgi:Ca2+/Na+ antiporter